MVEKQIATYVLNKCLRPYGKRRRAKEYLAKYRPPLRQVSLLDLVPMATLVQRLMAHKKGWRTFRTIETAKAPMATDEILCPFVSTDGKVQCADCRLCSGTSSKAKSIVIPLHGGKYNRKVA